MAPMVGIRTGGPHALQVVRASCQAHQHQSLWHAILHPSALPACLRLVLTAALKHQTGWEHQDLCTCVCTPAALSGVVRGLWHHQRPLGARMSLAAGLPPRLLLLRGSSSGAGCYCLLQLLGGMPSSDTHTPGTILCRPAPQACTLGLCSHGCPVPLVGKRPPLTVRHHHVPHFCCRMSPFVYLPVM